MIADLIFFICVIGIGCAVIGVAGTAACAVLYVVAIVLLLVVYGISLVVEDVILCTKEYNRPRRNRMINCFYSKHPVWVLWRANKKIKQKCYDLLAEMIMALLDLVS